MINILSRDSALGITSTLTKHTVFPSCKYNRFTKQEKEAILIAFESRGIFHFRNQRYYWDFFRRGSKANIA